MSWSRYLVLGSLLLSVAWPASFPAAGLEFTVNTTNDYQDGTVGDGECGFQLGSVRLCSLRAAVQEINFAPSGETAGSPEHTIYLSGSQVYPLSGGADTDSQGDLDLRRKVLIIGVGGKAVIDAQGNDRAIDMWSDSWLENLEIVNGAATSGGGLRVRAGAYGRLDHVVFRSNVANYGGAIYVSGRLTGTYVLVEDNRADISGGGLLSTGSEGASFYQSAFVGNEAPAGSASAFADQVFALFHNVTFSDNRGGFSVVYSEADFVSLSNVTIHGNDGAALGISPFTLGSYEGNLISGGCTAPLNLAIQSSNLESPGNSCEFSPADNQVNVADLSLRPLAYYGGPTPTHALRAGSPARALLTGDACDADQRGASREAPCDAGAFEFGAVTPLSGVFGDGFESGGFGAWSSILP